MGERPFGPLLFHSPSRHFGLWAKNWQCSIEGRQEEQVWLYFTNELLENAVWWNAMKFGLLAEISEFF